MLETDNILEYTVGLETDTRAYFSGVIVYLSTAFAILFPAYDVIGILFFLYL